MIFLHGAAERLTSPILGLNSRKTSIAQRTIWPICLMPDLTDKACLFGQKIADKTMPKICHYLCILLSFVDKKSVRSKLAFYRIF